jgi:alpha-beta hydrolase superfamily lysophospholipase
LTPLPIVERTPAFFEDGESPFFGWYHAAEDAPGGNSVAVICGPVGHEYTRAHRTVRHLADRLARHGIPALRFDYHGIGDSPGTDLDPDRLRTWQSNIRAAIERARALSGRGRVCLVGIRLGATLAALAAADEPVDQLVVWNPCVDGKRYLRELQAIAMSAERAADDSGGALESAGFVMSAQTLDSVKRIDLRAIDLRSTRRVLVLGRDDLAADPSFSEHLARGGVASDYMTVPGWSGMMAEHQFTVVPDAALDAIVNWAERGAPAAAGRKTGDGPGFAKDRLDISFRDESGREAMVEERICRFGPDGSLFGILTRGDADTSRTAILMFNAGSVHHVGPSRIYVTLARSLAAMGFVCLRFDLEGIGDSVLRAPGRENHPYPDNAPADARSALDFLHAQGYSRFLALGLCSGAHAAFHLGLTAQRHDIAELILINPLIFYWAEGMSLATVSRFEDVKAYKRSMRDPARWLRLLRGDVNMKRLLEVGIAHPRAVARSYYDTFCEALLPRKAPRLSQDLRRLLEMNREVTFLISEGDAGRDILMADARRTASKALKSGRMRLETIPGGDHTFSQSKPRKDMIDRLSAHLRSRLDESRAR